MRPSLGLVLRPLRRVTRTFRATRRTVEAVPDLVEAILVLPEISKQLDVISFQTATLPEMHAEIARMKGDTEALARLARIADRFGGRRGRYGVSAAIARGRVDV